MKIIKAAISEKSMKTLSRYGTKWYTNNGIEIAIELNPEITINFIVLGMETQSSGESTK